MQPGLAMAASIDDGAVIARRLMLDGAVNCRDLGGYRTCDGRRLRFGRVYRSDQFADLSDADVQQIAALGLRTVCDLRAPSEREQKPNRVWPQSPQPQVLGFMPYRGDELIADTREGRITAQQIEERVREIYRRFVIDHTATYSQLLHLIADAESLPLLFHCTSGRDRTGFATAILVMALGVPQATIVQDYRLSDHYRRDLAFQVGKIDPLLMATLTQSHPDYLAAAFEVMRERWGSEQAYLRDGLGFGIDRQRHLQALLLEPDLPD